MVGLGCGARSYTRRLHYSREYGVGSQIVKGILDDYIERPQKEFACADYGFQLDDEDQRRRYVIVSLLQADGLSCDDYRRQLTADPTTDLNELSQLESRGLATITKSRIKLTPRGMERSDVIGPWLYSRRVNERMEGYRWD